MRASLPQEFFTVFAKGFKYYLKGKWIKARMEFNQIEKIKGTPDYPTRTLLNFMDRKKFQAPDDWNGFRILTEK